MHDHDLDRLHKNLGTLREILADLNTNDDFERLVPIWRRPGWTTPAEFLLVAGTLDSMVTLSRHLVELKGVLINGSEQVGLQG